MIVRAHIRGYKSLEDVEVKFNPLTVIFGPNASGKSNLFDVLNLVSKIVTKRNLREAFNEHRGSVVESFYYGENDIESILSRESAEFCIEIDVKISEKVCDLVEKRISEMRYGLELEKSPKKRVTEKYLRYRICVEFLTGSGHLRIKDEFLCALTTDGKPTERRKPFIEKSGDRLILRMEGQAHPSNPDIGLDHALVSTPLYEPHYPHIAAFREEVSHWQFYYLEPKELMRSDNPLQEVHSLDSRGSNLAAFYNSLKILNNRQFDAINKAISLFLPRIERIDIDRNSHGDLQLKVFENGVPYSARIVSEGTLRVLGMLAITKSAIPSSVIGFEEPENGVHPQRLKNIADLLKGASENPNTQIIINTHSPDLPDYFSVDNLLSCRKKGRSTLFESIKETGFFVRGEILDRFNEDITPISERIRRGDFGG